MLFHLPYLENAETRMISAENPTGEKGGACRWDPDPTNPMLPHSEAALDLGRGWKVRPFIKLASQETAVLADIEGPGSIRHFFITSDLHYYSELVLRIYWDDEETPSVESPLGAFFAMGHDSEAHLVNSVPVIVAPRRGMNCYWQMPFRKRARFTLTNDGPQDAFIVAYKILYNLHDVPDHAAYFHAQWRRTLTSEENPEHVIIDGVEGNGHYVGTYLAWNALNSNWWGEGEVKFYLDGDGEFPTIADTGTEDYFGGAWGFSDFSMPHTAFQNHEQEFNTAFFGMPLARKPENAPRKFSLYRWHIQDPIRFRQNLKVTVQSLGWYPRMKRYRPLADDIASVAYWYQQEPHRPFPELPPLHRRWDR